MLAVSIVAKPAAGEHVTDDAVDVAALQNARAVDVAALRVELEMAEELALVTAQNASEREKALQGRMVELMEALQMIAAERDAAELSREAAEEARDALAAMLSQAAPSFSGMGRGLLTPHPPPADGEESADDEEEEEEEDANQSSNADIVVIDQEAEADVEGGVVELADAGLMPSHEAELAASLMEAAVHADVSEAEGDRASPAPMDELHDARAQIDEMSAQLHAAADAQAAAGEYVDLQQEMIRELEELCRAKEAEVSERDAALEEQLATLQASEARAEELAARLDAAGGAPSGDAPDAMALDAMASSRGMASWAEEARKGRRLSDGGSENSGSHPGSHGASRRSSRAPSAGEGPREANLAPSAVSVGGGDLASEVRFAVATGGASRLERSLGVSSQSGMYASAPTGSQPALVKPVRSGNGGAGGRAGMGGGMARSAAVQLGQTGTAGAASLLMSGRMPPPGAVLKLAKNIGKEGPAAPMGGAARRAKQQTRTLLPVLGSSVAGPPLPAREPASAMQMDTHAHSPVGDFDASERGLYRSSYPPASVGEGTRPTKPAGAPMMTYGKDGRMVALKGRTASAARPAPLQRAAMGAANRTGAGLSVGGPPDAGPWRSSAGDEPPLAPLAPPRPPIGASPGELRLWKVQNGIAT